MSSVQNIILTGSLGVVDDRLERINEFINTLDTVSKGPGLKLVNKDSNSYGGTKHLEFDVAIGAFNYLPLFEFIQGLREIFEFAGPYEVVQLIYNDQQDDGLRIVTIAGDPEVEDKDVPPW